MLCSAFAVADPGERLVSLHSVLPSALLRPAGSV